MFLKKECSKMELPQINALLNEIGNYSLLVVAEWKERVRASGLKLCDLSLGDPQEPTPEFIRKRLVEAVTPSSSYPPAGGVAALRQAAAGWLQRRFGLAVSEQAIVPTSGSKEAIFHFPSLLAGPLRIAYPVPGYPVYESSIVFHGHLPQPVQLRPEHDFALAPETYFAKENLPHVLWVCSPHNPTGTVLSVAKMEKILFWCQKNGVLLLSDECYVDSFDPGSPKPTSFLQLVKDIKFKGVLSFFSLSKRSGMTGYRSGFVTGDATYIEALKKFRPHAGLAGPAFVQEAAAVAWNDDAHVDDRGKIYAAKRKAVIRFLAERNWEYVQSESTFYVWAKLPESYPVARDYLAALASRTGIVATPGDCFGESQHVAHWFRIALVPELADLQASLDLWRVFEGRQP